MIKPKIEFWFEFASTYSYLSVMRLTPLAHKARVDVIWRPFLLGPIFAAQGWKTSPFNIYPAKGQNMWRDMERQAHMQGLPFHKPDPFPQNGIWAARTAQLALETPGGRAFCQNIFSAQFAKGLDISEPQVVRACLQDSGLSGELYDEAQTEDNKLALRKTTQEAAQRGLFGAPSFLVGPELFWGDDRLEQALDWAAEHV